MDYSKLSNASDEEDNITAFIEVFLGELFIFSILNIIKNYYSFT